MRLSLTIAVASLLVGGCTRDNPAFGLNQTGSAGETLGPEGDGDGDLDASGASAEEGSGPETDASTGDAGDGDDGGPAVDLPPCSEGSGWLRIPVVEDNFLYWGFSGKEGCLFDPGDLDDGGIFPPVYGPSNVPCTDLNFGKAPDFFLHTSQEGRTGLLARLDLEDYTGRGINAYSAHYKFAVVYSEIPGEVVVSLAPIRDDQADWDAGHGLGQPYIAEESTYTYRSAPEAWDGDNAFSVLDLTKLLTAQWLEGENNVEIEVPYGRVQAWLDDDGRADPGFILWTDVVEPFGFYVSANEGPAGGELWIDACVDDA